MAWFGWSGTFGVVVVAFGFVVGVVGFTAGVVVAGFAGAMVVVVATVPDGGASGALTLKTGAERHPLPNRMTVRPTMRNRFIWEEDTRETAWDTRRMTVYWPRYETKLFPTYRGRRRHGSNVVGIRSSRTRASVQLSDDTRMKSSRHPTSPPEPVFSGTRRGRS